MSTPSNLYAEKIFAEHPSSLWPLDDSADYVSLIFEDQRNILSWQVSGGTVEESVAPKSPFPDSVANKILGNYAESPTTVASKILLISEDIVGFDEMSNELETFAVGAHIFAKSIYVNSYEIGYEYTPVGASQPMRVFRKFPSSISGQWSFISETFQVPDGVTTESLRIYLAIEYLNSGSGPEDYEFFVNGITLGQWSEEFNATSLGISSVIFPDAIAVDVDQNTYAVEAKAYGLQENSGYYFIQKNKLLAKNSGVPMVYGSDSVTRIFPNNDMPSLIIPGQGLLNDTGRYRDYTLEAWVKADCQSRTPKRLFGPIASSDGVYADGPFIKLKIGNEVGSHYINEWFRPLLLALRLKDDVASLLINGEEVISFPINAESLVLPKETDQRGRSQDWIGFYAYEDVRIVELDCVAIYPYWTPEIVAKRRWLYGQAVELPENANTSFGGTSVAIDYSVADYTNNYNYPEFGKFSQGIVENLDTSNNSLDAPSYRIPEIRFLNQDLSIDEWYRDQEQLQDEDRLFFTFKDLSAFMFLDNLNFMRQPTKAIYGIFGLEEFSINEKVLFKIENIVNRNYFKVFVKGDTVNYKIKYGNQEELLYTDPIIDSTNIFAGINIDGLSRLFGRNVSAFFGNRSQLRLYIAGDSDFSQTFDGKIYKIGVCTERNFRELAGLFEFPTYLDLPEVWNAGDQYFRNDPAFWNLVIDGGDVPAFAEDSQRINAIYDHTASYTVIPTRSFGNYKLDIAISSKWQDYLPLTYFAEYVSDSFNKKYYDLDFIQFNVSYPNYNLGDLSGDEDYSVKTYITFQYLREGANKTIRNFPNTEYAENGVLDIGRNLNWITTKYEVANGTVIYPPRGVSITELAIVTHIDILVKGISQNPLKIRRLEYASKAINEQSLNYVGTKFGTKVIPYKKFGSYFDYTSKNPYRIYKGSTPYLYLTRDSGIQKVGEYDPLTNRGFIVQINQNLSEFYKVFAMQMFLRFPESSFPQIPIEIFEIQGKDDYIKFFAVANDRTGKRGKIYAINARTGQVENGIVFYINGKIVREPVIDIQDWAVLGVNFARILSFDSYPGAIRITSPIIVNNISQYQSTSLQEVQRQIYRPWFRVSQIGTQDLEWIFWRTNFTWNGVLVANETKLFGFDPSDVYKAYTGTSKILIDDDQSVSVFRGFQYSAYRDVQWSENTLRPL